MDREKAILQQAFVRYKNTILKAHMKMAKNSVRIIKPADASEKFRQAGNALYGKKIHNDQIHLEILYFYCRAILVAPNDSEHLALGYGNRSALSLHLKKYEDCIKDCDRAVNITNSNLLKVKLLCRKAECLKKMGSSEADTSLKEAATYVNKMDNKSKKSYSALIDKVKAMTLNVVNNVVEERTVTETKNATDFISIGYSKKFGRHLLAAKDYAPGDIIFVEKTYASTVNPRMTFTNCDYCLKTAWSGVPCEHCSWTIFCSEECREKAAKLYHDVECALIPFLLTLRPLLDSMKPTIRAAIIAIREAGSISELMTRLKAVDECTDVKTKGFYKNGEFKSNTIESMYSLCNDYPEADSLFVSQGSAFLVVLIGFCTQSKLIDINLRKVDDLMKSKELIFLGSLMMKLLAIRRNTNDALFGKYETCEQGESMDDCFQKSCCVRGFFMASLTSLINHSCCPNAVRCFTENQQIIIHAMHPIKKGEQITIAYSCSFYHEPLLKRKMMLGVRNIFECFCQACKENWPPVLTMSAAAFNKRNLGGKAYLEEKLHLDCATTLQAFEVNSTIKDKFSYFTTEDLEKLSKAVTEAFQNLRQPSHVICFLAQALGDVFAYVYGLKPRLSGTECH